MASPLTRDSRVIHTNRARSYGVGKFVSPAGTGLAKVAFPEGERTVLESDLSPERALPLAPRPPRPYAQVRALQEASREIEALYMPDRAVALQRVETIIRGQSDPAWAAEQIVDYFEGAKA